MTPSPTIRIRSEAVGVLGIKVLGTAFALGAQLTLARRLGPDGIGAYALAMALLNALLVFSRMGFDVSPLKIATLLSEDADASRLRGFLQVGRAVPVLAGLLLGALTAGIVWWTVPPGYVRTSLLLACIGLPAWTVLLVDQGVLRALGSRVAAFIPGELVRPGLLLVALLAGSRYLFEAGHAPRAVAFHVGAIFVGAVVGVVLVRRTVPADVRTARAVRDTQLWIRASVALGIVISLNALLNQVDTLVIGSLLDTADVGLFSVAKRVAALLAFGLLAVNAVVAPGFAGLHRAGDVIQLGRLARRAARLATAVTLPLALLLIATGRWVLVLFGPDFVDAYPLLVFFCVGQVANAACGPVALLLGLTGHARDAARILVVALLALVSGCFAVVPRFGVVGAAATSAIVLVGWNVGMVAMSQSRLGIRGSVV